MGLLWKRKSRVAVVVEQMSPTFLAVGIMVVVVVVAIVLDSAIVPTAVAVCPPALIAATMVKIAAVDPVTFVQVMEVVIIVVRRRRIQLRVAVLAAIIAVRTP